MKKLFVLLIVTALAIFLATPVAAANITADTHTGIRTVNVGIVAAPAAIAAGNAENTVISGKTTVNTGTDSTSAKIAGDIDKGIATPAGTTKFKSDDVTTEETFLSHKAIDGTKAIQDDHVVAYTHGKATILGQAGLKGTYIHTANETDHHQIE